MAEIRTPAGRSSELRWPHGAGREQASTAGGSGHPWEGETKEASVHASKTTGGRHRDLRSEAILEHSKPLREEKRP